jgi:hypothetical protein
MATWPHILQQMSDSTARGYDAIEEQFLSEGDLFGLRFRRGYVFLEVSSAEDVSYDPYSGYDSVRPGTGSGYQQLEDGNDDVLFVPSGQEKVLHTAIGHKPAILRRYTQYPDGDITLRKHPELGSPSATQGSDWGYIGGEQSPYDQPTGIEELMIVPNVTPSFSFYNPSPDSDHTPILNVTAMKYNINTLSVDNHENQIRRIVSPGSPMPIYNVGSAESRVSYDLQSDWGTPTVPESTVNSLRRS